LSLEHAWRNPDAESDLIDRLTNDNLAMIKTLRTDEEFRKARFVHEIRLYQAFTANPPLVRCPC